MELDEEDEDFAVKLRVIAAQVQTIFTAQLRADEGRFRKKSVDTLSKLLERIALEERRTITVLN